MNLFKFIFKHPAHLVALGFGSGLIPKSPGTFGTIFGWITFLLLEIYLNKNQILLIILFSFFIGLWACKITAENLKIADPGIIVWDEIIAIWLVLYLVFPINLLEQFIVFIIFRCFDIFKPWPIKFFDNYFKGFGYKGSFGIIIDDLIAAIFSLIIFYLLIFFNLF